MKECFLKFNRSNRLYKLGIPNVECELSIDSTCMYVPYGHTLDKEGNSVDEITRGQRIELHPSFTLNMKDHFNLLLDANPELYSVMDVNLVRVLQPGEEEYFKIVGTAKKKFDPSKLKYLLRMYCVGV